MPSTDSEASRAVIPVESRHRFRLEPSGRQRSGRRQGASAHRICPTGRSEMSAENLSNLHERGTFALLMLKLPRPMAQRPFLHARLRRELVACQAACAPGPHPRCPLRPRSSAHALLRNSPTPDASRTVFVGRVQENILICGGLVRESMRGASLFQGRQWPAEQTDVAPEQTVPHPPQLAGSTMASVQAVPHVISAPGH